jgi:TonB family protein
MLAAPEQAGAQGLGTQMAEALQKSKIHTVLVFDFIGPKDELNALGQDLADKFSTTLQKSSSNFTVVDRADVKKLIETNRVAADIVRDTEIAWWLATQLKADAFILGKLSIDGDTLKIEIGAIATKDGKSIASFSLPAPISGAMKARMAIPVATAIEFDKRLASVRKETMPVCLHCPNPEFSQAAVANHIEGTVVLVGVIGLDGRAREIDVRKPVSYRLTEKAIEAVQKWTYRPATGADGTPVELLTTIEVVFKLSR